MSSDGVRSARPVALHGLFARLFLMTSPGAADTGSMELCDTWRCPGCGALVVLPAVCASPLDALAERRLDQLAQASCGCWVATLSNRDIARLLEAIVGADERASGSARAIAGRRC